MQNATLTNIASHYTSDGVHLAYSAESSIQKGFKGQNPAKK